MTIERFALRVAAAKPLGWDCPARRGRAWPPTIRVAGIILDCSATFRIGPT
jgi:hypothetical protein